LDEDAEACGSITILGFFNFKPIFVDVGSGGTPWSQPKKHWMSWLVVNIY
jgi:hypothetical protein